MTNNSLTLEKLNDERELLRAKLRETEVCIKEDIHLLEQHWKPVINDVLTENDEPSQKSEMVKNLLTVSAGVGLDLLLTRVVMKNSSPFKKMIVSALVQNGVPFMLGEMPMRLILKLKSARRRR